MRCRKHVCCPVCPGSNTWLLLLSLSLLPATALTGSHSRKDSSRLDSRPADSNRNSDWRKTCLASLSMSTTLLHNTILHIRKMSGCEVTSVCTLNIAREPVFVFTIESQWGGGGRRGSWVETDSWSLKLTNNLSITCFVCPVSVVMIIMKWFRFNKTYHFSNCSVTSSSYSVIFQSWFHPGQWSH